MQALPLPILSFVLSAAACVMIWRLEVGSALARGLFTAVFALIAATTLLTGLRFGYGVESFAPVQRVVPLFIGPLIYLGFLAYTRPPAQMRRPIVLHLSIWAIVAVLPQVIPSVRVGYDAAIAVSYLVAAIGILQIWRRGADALALAPLELTRGLRVWMLVAASMLAVMLVFDAAIAVSFATGQREEALTLISAGSVVSALGLLAAIISFSNRRTPEAAISPPPAAPTATVPDEARQLEHRTKELLVDTRLFLDTDLTLDRLAKRLHVPARALSEAINQTQNMNVSQYVNSFRLTHAAQLLATTDLTVTQVTEHSGFLTRSNFYREFERVFAMSPTAYRKAKKS
ncbi:helix-turn-helix transcriptional regulator [Rhodobacteraceae bacterium N5(2021)]|uniref:Helix-turn-helix transcriptional regulator n=1 Tax=Gymnodinialimonas phycosphaerae TaxID=2841589 RepID=A0A975YFJ9_9RHOB|nr:helix-turn-helix transcriptional regulator [Gymnodinialimonas phycosphaerae]MBY4894796.1 helix-turn-helix transcriptional regulator [Gymnodinialimonas phycosphaerae]